MNTDISNNQATPNGENYLGPVDIPTTIDPSLLENMSETVQGIIGDFMTELSPEEKALALIDANNDGATEKREATNALREFKKNKRAMHAGRGFDASYDIDGDGKLTHLDRKYIRRTQKLIHKYDRERLSSDGTVIKRDGIIDDHEAAKLYTDLVNQKISSELQKPEFQATAKALLGTNKSFNLIDSDKDGMISAADYTKTLAEMHLSIRSGAANPNHDVSGDGEVTQDDIKQMEAFGQSLGFVTEAEAQAIGNAVALIDSDSDGVVNYKDFNKALVKSYLTAKAQDPNNANLATTGEVSDIGNVGNVLGLIDHRTSFQALINSVDITDTNDDGVVTQNELFESNVHMGKNWDDEFRLAELLQVIDPEQYVLDEIASLNPDQIFDVNENGIVDANDTWSHFFVAEAVSDISQENYDNVLIYASPEMEGVGYDDGTAMDPDIELDPNSKVANLVDVNGDNKISFREAFEAYVAASNIGNILSDPRSTAYFEEFDFDGIRGNSSTDKEILKSLLLQATSLTEADLDAMEDQAHNLGSYHGVMATLRSTINTKAFNLADVNGDRNIDPEEARSAYIAAVNVDQNALFDPSYPLDSRFDYTTGLFDNVPDGVNDFYDTGIMQDTLVETSSLTRRELIDLELDVILGIISETHHDVAPYGSELPPLPPIELPDLGAIDDFDFGSIDDFDFGSIDDFDFGSIGDLDLGSIGDLDLGAVGDLDLGLISDTESTVDAIEPAIDETEPAVTTTPDGVNPQVLALADVSGDGVIDPEEGTNAYIAMSNVEQHAINDPTYYNPAFDFNGDSKNDYMGDTFEMENSLINAGALTNDQLWDIFMNDELLAQTHHGVEPATVTIPEDFDPLAFLNDFDFGSLDIENLDFSL